MHTSGGLGGFRRPCRIRQTRDGETLQSVAVPWRCHRSLIADALVIHDFRVEEIIDPTRCQNHSLTPFARVDGMTLD